LKFFFFEIFFLNFQAAQPVNGVVLARGLEINGNAFLDLFEIR